MVTKLPFTVMALGVDCNEGDVIPPQHPCQGIDDGHKEVSEGGGEALDAITCFNRPVRLRTARRQPRAVAWGTS